MGIILYADVDSPWRDTDLENGALLLEILPREIVQGGAKAAERPQHGIRVVRFGQDPDVDIHCGTRIAVRRKRVRANEKEFNLLVDQGL